MPDFHTSDLPIPKSWDEFEDLVWHVFSRLWADPRAQRHGRQGQPQQGVDISGRPASLDGRYAGIQCKRYGDKRLTKAHVEAEVAKAEGFVPPLAEYYIATTSSRDAKLQAAVRGINAGRATEGKFLVHLVFWEDLCSHLTDVRNRDVLVKFYGHMLQGANAAGPSLDFARDLHRETFKLGDRAAAQFPYVSAPLLEQHRAAVQALRDAGMAESAKHGILVLGEASAGKTRLALEALVEALPDWPVLRWSTALSINDAPSAGMMVGGDVVVFIDDLHEYVLPAPPARDAAGFVVDPRAATLRTLLETLRMRARRVVVVGTCRTEEEQSARAGLSWLFAELAPIAIPRFASQRRDPAAARIIEEFADRGAAYVDEWDGTLGSLVLGLRTKNAEYLTVRNDPAASILRAMKLLTLASTTAHTVQRLRAVCADVFGEAQLRASEKAWRRAVDRLVELQFVSEELLPTEHAPRLVIRSDAYFADVVTDYPAPGRPHQLTADLEHLRSVLVELHDGQALTNLGAYFFKRREYERCLAICDQVIEVDSGLAYAWSNKAGTLQQLRRYEDALAAAERALALDLSVAGIWSNKAAALASLGRSDEALEAADRGIALAPLSALAWANRAGFLADMKQWPQAIDSAERAIALDAGLSIGWANLAVTLLRSRRYEEALEACERAISLDPGNALTWANEATILHNLHQHPEALAAAEHALQLDPTLASAWMSKGASTAEIGHYPEALEATERALALDDTLAEAWANKGMILGNLGRYAEALGALDRAIDLDGENAAAWSNKGAALASLGRLAEGVEACDRALAIDPASAETWMTRSNALNRLGHYDDALEASAQVLALRPSAFAWVNRAVTLLHLGRYEDTYHAADNALSLNGEIAQAWHLKSCALGGMGRHEDALAASERAVALNPAIEDAWANRLTALLELGRETEAARATAEARVQGCSSAVAQVWKNRAVACYQNQQFPEALVAFDTVLSLDPDDADAWALKCGALASIGRDEEAIAAAERALAIDPTHAIAWTNQGAALANLARYEESLAASQKAVAYAPHQANAWANCGTALGGLGRYIEGLTAYRRAISEQPTHVPAWIGQGMMLGHLERYGEALHAFDQAVLLAPQMASLRQYRADTLRGLGRDEEAAAADLETDALEGK